MLFDEGHALENAAEERRGNGSMNSRLISICAIACLLAGAATVSATSAEKVKNDKVRVEEVRLLTGAWETLPDHRPTVLVYLAGTDAKLSFADGTQRREKIERGESVPEPASLRAIANSGPIPLHYVRVEFLTGGSGEMWHMTGLPPDDKLLFEDRYSRTYEIRVAAHAREPQHTHHDRVTVCLSGAKLEHTLPDGSVQPSTLTTGEIAWRPAQTHSGHNVGDTDLRVIAIEPK